MKRKSKPNQWKAILWLSIVTLIIVALVLTQSILTLIEGDNSPIVLTTLVISAVATFISLLNFFLSIKVMRDYKILELKRKNRSLLNILNQLTKALENGEDPKDLTALFKAISSDLKNDSNSY